MDVYMSEEEQIRKIKEWWNKYGTAILLAIIIFLLASFGWRYWQHYKTKHAEQASVIYEQMVAANMMHKADDFKLYSGYLLKDYSGTPYASLAAFMLAKQAVDNKDLTAAATNLDWVVKHADSGRLKQIARIREARILLALKKPDAALKLLATVNSDAYNSMVAETKGDIYVAMGNKAQALKFYNKALNGMQGSKAELQLLKMKINQLQG